MKKNLISIAVGYAFMALGAQSVYADEAERVPAEESQSDIRGDAEGDAKKNERIGIARTLQVESAQYDDVPSTVVAVGRALEERAIPEGNATGSNAIAIGVGSTASGPQTIAIGLTATATQLNGIAYGTSAQATGQGGIALGLNSKATGTNSLGLGVASAGVGQNGVALGTSAKANGANSVAIGSDSVADGDYVVSVGNSGKKRVVTNVAAGSILSGSSDAVTGDQLYEAKQDIEMVSGNLTSLSTSTAQLAEKFNTPVLGRSAVASGGGAVAVGANAGATGLGSIAIGTFASARNDNGDGGTIAVGRFAEALTQGSIAIGESAKAAKGGHNYNAIAIGMNADASEYRSVALGSDSTTDRQATVSVGSSSFQRQITNVGAGTQTNDAVNLGQISTLLGGTFATDGSGNVVNPSYQIGETSYNNVKAAVEAAAALASGGTPNAVVYDDSDHNKLTLGGTEASAVTLTNVANGISASDAVNAGQLKGVADVLGAEIGQDGTLAKPGYMVNGKAYDNVREALAAAAASGGGGSVGSDLVVVGGFGQGQPSGNLADIGPNGNASEDTAVAIGLGANAAGISAIAMGLNSAAKSDYSLALGSSASTSADQEYSVAIGSKVSTGGKNALALGSNTEAKADNAIAIGNNDAQAFGVNSIALGSAAKTKVGVANAIALGANSSASGANSIAFGSGSIADRDNALSIGSSTAQRQIINVAAGQKATDAMNYGQLAQALGGNGTVGSDGSVTAPEYVIAGTTYTNVKDAVQAAAQVGSDINAVSYDDEGGSAVSLRGESGTTIKNVKAGELSVDSMEAVNGSQLFATDANVTQNTTDIAGLKTDVEQNTTDVAALKTDVAQNTTDVAALKTDVEQNTVDITDLQTGKAGLVRQDSDTADVKVAATTGGAMDFSGVDGARVLKGVANGNVIAGSTDAVNGGQLFNAKTEIKDELAGDLASGAIDLKYIKVKADGVQAQASGSQSVAIGGGAAATAANALAFGQGSNAKAKNSVALGYNSVAKDEWTVSVGDTGAERKIVHVRAGDVSADSTDAVNGGQLFEVKQLIGSTTSTQAARFAELNARLDGQPDYVVVGGYGQGQPSGNLADIGPNGNASEDTAVAIGLGANAAGISAIAMGLNSAAKSDYSLALGSSASTSADQEYSVAIGSKVSTGGKNALALGSNTEAKADNAIAIGNNDAQAFGVNSIALGSAAKTKVGVENAIALGANSSASGVNSIAFGSSSIADRDNALSIGSSTAQRQIINVAAGTMATDAVNYGQLATALGGNAAVGSNGSVTAPEYVIAGTTYTNVKDAVEAAAQVGGGDGTASPNSVVYDTAEHNKLTLGGTSALAPVTLTNIANGAITAGSTDAMNGSQLYGTAQSVATAISGKTTVGSDGKLTASIDVNGKNYETVEGAIQAAAQTGSGVSATSVLYDNEERTKLTLGGPTKAGAPVKLTNVANGSIAADSSDAVNGSQLYDTAQSVASTIGGGTTVGADGKLANTSIEVNGGSYKTVEEAIQAAAASSVTDSMAVKYDDDSRTSVTLGGTAAGAPIVLSNVANGVSQYDAVNFGQLSELASKVGDVDGRVSILEQAPAGGSGGSGSSPDAGGSTGGSTADWDLNAGGEKITNVGSATEKTDAVNLGQMNDAIQASVGLPAGTTAKDYTDQQIQGVRGQINDVSKNAYSGIAAATALTMIPGVDPGKTLSFGIGGATYKGYQAVAFGGEARINQNLKVKAGVGLSSGGNTVGMGASYQW